MTVPSTPWSGIEIEQKMCAVIALLDDAVAAYKDLGEKAAQARHAFKAAEAKAMLSAKADKTLSSAELRKAAVYQECGSLDLAADIAENSYAAQRQVIAALQSQGEILRSLSRSNRDMHDQPGWGGQRSR